VAQGVGSEFKPLQKKRKIANSPRKERRREGGSKERGGDKL
jgi:hypothetical protein